MDDQRSGYGAPDSCVLVGESAAIQRTRRQIQQIADLGRTTLLTGPTGSGKDVIARALHFASNRRDRAFTPVHCAALPEALVEAELFGYSRGAFTGAMQARPGLVRSAASGTLFLDEIDSLSLTSQAKLLRFLDTGEYRAVGSDNVGQASVWVIAATNQDLRKLVRCGHFREDLMYRLEVLQIAVPALAERPGDIEPLAYHFLKGCGQSDKRLHADAIRALLAHSWPGNVRELKHRIEAAALLCAGLEVTAEMLNLPNPTPVAHAIQTVPVSLPSTGDDALEHELWRLVAAHGLTLTESISVCEQALVKAALRAEDNNRRRAADRLGIHVRTIYKKLGGTPDVST